MFFENCTVMIYEPEKVGDFDEYTGAEQEQYVLKSTVGGDFQPSSNSDGTYEYGKDLEDTYKLYLNPKVIVTDRSILKIGNSTYEVIGSPIVYNHFINHIKLELRKERVNSLEQGD